MAGRRDAETGLPMLPLWREQRISPGIRDIREDGNDGWERDSGASPAGEAGGVIG